MRSSFININILLLFTSLILSTRSDFFVCLSNFSAILHQVSQYLRSKNWDTRVAAARAIGAIAENVNHTSLPQLFSCFKSKLSDFGMPGISEDLLALPDFHSNVAGISFRRSLLLFFLSFHFILFLIFIFQLLLFLISYIC